MRKKRDLCHKHAMIHKGKECNPLSFRNARQNPHIDVPIDNLPDTDIGKIINAKQLQRSTFTSLICKSFLLVKVTEAASISTHAVVTSSFTKFVFTNSFYKVCTARIFNPHFIVV